MKGTDWPAGLDFEERWILARRRAGELSYRDLADRVADLLGEPVNYEYLRRMAGGVSHSPMSADTVDVPTFAAVCLVLGVDPDWLWPEVTPRLFRQAIILSRAVKVPPDELGRKRLMR